MKDKARGSAAGFTLIEVLISISIGAVLILILAEILSATLTGQMQAAAQVGISQREEAAIRVLRQTVSNMLPPTPDGREHFITASTDALEFFTLPPQSRGADGIMRARIATEASQDGQYILTLELLPVTSKQPRPERPARRTLLAGLASVHLSYVFPDAPNTSAQFPRRSDLPTLVVLNWAYPGNAKDVRELAVRPRLGMSGRCHLDMTSGTCRAS